MCYIFYSKNHLHIIMYTKMYSINSICARNVISKCYELQMVKHLWYILLHELPNINTNYIFVQHIYGVFRLDVNLWTKILWSVFSRQTWKQHAEAFAQQWLHDDDDDDLLLLLFQMILLQLKWLLYIIYNDLSEKRNVDGMLLP